MKNSLYDSNPRFSNLQAIALYCGAVIVLLLSMHYRLGPELADDGAFFLRYAENMLKGEFWVWNLGEAPVWGASAPLYPLLIAFAMKLGLTPESAIVGVGLTLSSVSLAAVTLMLGHRFGVIAGLGFLVLSATDTGMMYFSGAGLETPLTIALLALALWTLLYQSSPLMIGLIAGLLMINKLDLVPVGGLLLLAHWIQNKSFPKYAVIVALSIATAWYGFAWWYFGAPVPNSFLTKSLYQENQPKQINWTWFGGFLFWVSIHKWLLPLSATAIWLNYRSLIPLFTLFVGVIAVHVAAYTIKYPFEPYNWYAMPALFSLLIISAIGLDSFAKWIHRWIPIPHAYYIISILILIVAFGSSFKSEMFGTASIKRFAEHIEFDRAEAGRWVAENTPKDFVVYTMWGNPAYYSNRKVLDGSFLNRKFEENDIIKTYRPEILILQGASNPDSTPMNPVFSVTKSEEYRVIKVFEKSYAADMRYFYAVLAREDVLDKIRNIDPPRDLMTFVAKVSAGDQFGALRPQGLGTLFVHPGETTATSFEFDAAGYAGPNESKTINLHARIAPNIPQDAIERGAGNVRVQVLQGTKLLVDGIVKVGEPLQRNLPAGEPLQFVVDNNGGPDSDWLLLSIH